MVIHNIDWTNCNPKYLGCFALPFPSASLGWVRSLPWNRFSDTTTNRTLALCWWYRAFQSLPERWSDPPFKDLTEARHSSLAVEIWIVSSDFVPVRLFRARTFWWFGDSQSIVNIFHRFSGSSHLNIRTTYSIVSSEFAFKRQVRIQSKLPVSVEF